MSYLVAAFAVVLAAAMYWLRPEAVEEAYVWILRIRRVVGGIAAMIIALVLIGSGATTLMLVGASILVVATWFAIIEDPEDRIRGLLP